MEGTLGPFVRYNTLYVEQVIRVPGNSIRCWSFTLKLRDWGRILGQNPDKNIESFSPCYSKTPLQLCLEIYISSTQPLTVSTVQLVYTVKERGGKPNRKPCPLPYGLRNPYRNLKIMPSLQRQFRLYIPFLEIAWPQPQFPHSCVFERFI